VHLYLLEVNRSFESWVVLGRTGGSFDAIQWSGRSAVVGGEPYEIFLTEDAWRLAEMRCDGASPLPVTRDGKLVTTGCRPGASGEIRWQARFDEAGGARSDD
jgi:hypothetical protein